jgi:UPF0755 protein
MIQRVLVLLLGLAFLGAVAIGELRQVWAAPLQVPEQGFVLTIAPGDSLRAVAAELHKEGVLPYPALVILYGRWTGLDQQVKPGEYLLSKGTTAESMLLLLQSGRVIQYQVTLPEGITLARALTILAQQERLTKTLAGTIDPRLIDIIKPHTLPEGLFFPDTYTYVRGDSDWSILQRAHSKMLSVLQDEWRQRASDLPLEDPYDALILASIIERETGLPEEREEISGVFVRRLQQGMYLQTDPTVIYGLGVEFKGNLQRSHLREVSNPYNTYRHPGLPPTPIALPGRGAIRAALHPDAGSSLYFVARGDGGHVFSDTLAQHNKAVHKYQLRPSKDYRSTPERAK